MPITDRSQAKEGGFGQVRAALVKFVGDCVSVESGQWGGQLLDDEGKPRPPKEFWEIVSENNQVLESTEELTMDISELFSFRVNCSEFKGSFYIDEFLGSVDKFKLQFPDGLIGKRVTWLKYLKEARDPKYNSTGFIIDKVEEGIGAAPGVTTDPVKAGIAEIDPLEVACELAIGKTEQQFRNAFGVHPVLRASQLLPLAQAGAITKMLVEQGKLVTVTEGNKTIYQSTKPRLPS